MGLVAEDALGLRRTLGRSPHGLGGNAPGGRAYGSRPAVAASKNSWLSATARSRCGDS